MENAFLEELYEHHFYENPMVNCLWRRNEKKVMGMLYEKVKVVGNGGQKCGNIRKNYEANGGEGKKWSSAHCSSSLFLLHMHLIDSYSNYSWPNSRRI